MMEYNRLLEKIKDNKVRVGVVGLGYVGLPLAVEFAKSKSSTTGFDIDKKKIAKLRKGENYIEDVSDADLKQVLREKYFSITSDFSSVTQLDAVIICVPTPLNKLRDPDLTFVTDAVHSITPYFHKGMLLILESTSYPGTTSEILSTMVRDHGLTIGEDVFVCFSPERIDPGNQIYKVRNTPKIVGGVTKKCTHVGMNLYKKIVDKVISVSSPETAEMVKLLENTFRSINIGLVNEVAIMCERLGINVWEVIDAAATKPFGFMKFSPGPGIGGHCIPIDPNYLQWKLRTLDYDTKFIRVATDINTSMPKHVAFLITKGLNRQKKSLNGSRVLIIGVSYKKDTDDVRDSPSLEIIQNLKKDGVRVDFYDPYVRKVDIGDEVLSGLSILNKQVVSKYDLVAIVTDHSGIDYSLVKRYSKMIVDTRNVYPTNRSVQIIQLGKGEK